MKESAHMNRRGFFGLVGKLLAVGAAMGVAPSLLEPIEGAVDSCSRWAWVQVGGPSVDYIAAGENSSAASEVHFEGDPVRGWDALMEKIEADRLERKE